MTWVRTEDAMPLHPKVLRLSDGAYRLWSNGLHFANRATTNGRIDKALVPTLNHHGTWTPKQLMGFCAELATGLWLDRGDHYEIHDYAHHQAEAMKDRVERKREVDRLRQRRKRDKREDTERETLGLSRRDTERDNSGDTRPDTAGGSRRETSVPTRPDPIDSTSYSPRANGTHPTGIRAEALRTGYVERFTQAMPGIRAPRATNPGTSEPWLTVARLLTDAQVSTLLDAFFADEEPFTKDRAPTKIESQIVRLLAHGPTVNGKAQGATAPATRPTSAAEAAWLSAKQAHHDAFVSRAEPEVLYRLEQAEERALAALQAYRRGAA